MLTAIHEVKIPWISQLPPFWAESFMNDAGNSAAGLTFLLLKLPTCLLTTHQPYIRCHGTGLGPCLFLLLQITLSLIEDKEVASENISYADVVFCIFICLNYESYYLDLQS